MTGRRPRSTGRLAQALRTAEKAILLREIKKTGGHLGLAAQRLEISRRALYDKLKDYGLDGEAAGLRAEHGVQGPRRVERSDT